MKYLSIYLITFIGALALFYGFEAAAPEETTNFFTGANQPYPQIPVLAKIVFAGFMSAIPTGLQYDSDKKKAIG